MSHYIIESGAFERALESMPAHVSLPWRDVCSTEEGGDGDGEDGDDEPKKTKVKYSCACPKRSFWGKPDLTDIVCNICGTEFIPEM
jgi:hypothetical protein